MKSCFQNFLEAAFLYAVSCWQISGAIVLIAMGTFANHRHPFHVRADPPYPFQWTVVKILQPQRTGHQLRCKHQKAEGEREYVARRLPYAYAVKKRPSALPEQAHKDDRLQEIT